MIIARRHPAGLFNQILSFETLIGLGSLSNSTTIIYNCGGFINFSTNIKNRSQHLSQDHPKLFDLIDFKIKDNTILINNNIDIGKTDYINNVTSQTKNLSDYFVNANKDNILNIDAFSDGREELDLNKDYIFDQYTLEPYSHFFFNRTKQLDDYIFSVKIKKEYLNLAEKIANFLGDFNGAHIRRTDHRVVVDLTDEQIINGFKKLDGNRKIILCTDDFESIPEYNYTLIDNIIIDYFLDDFKQLPFSDEIVFALISNLVMHYAQDFVGTATSTYTSYINRHLHLKGRCNWKFFNQEITPKDDSLYSWQNIGQRTFSLLTEWEECKRVEN